MTSSTIHDNYGNIHDALKTTSTTTGNTPKPVTIRVPRHTVSPPQAPQKLEGKVSIRRISKPAGTITSATTGSSPTPAYVEVPANLIDPQTTRSLRVAFNALGIEKSSTPAREPQTLNTYSTGGRVAPVQKSSMDYEIVKSALKSGNLSGVVVQLKAGLIEITPKITREILLEKHQKNYQTNPDYLQALQHIVNAYKNIPEFEQEYVRVSLVLKRLSEK